MRHIKQFFEIFSLLSLTFRFKVCFVFLLMLILSTLEIFSLSLLAGFVYFLTDIDSFFIKFPSLPLTDHLLSLDNIVKVKLFILLIILTFITKNILIFLVNIYFYNFNRQLNLNISTRVLNRYLNSEYLFFLQSKISEIINISKDETIRFCGIIMSYLNIFKELVLIALIILGIITINLKVTLSIFLTVFIISTFIIYLLRLPLIRLGEKRTYYTSKVYKNLYDIFFGIKFIKVRFLEKIFLAKIIKVYSSLMDVMFSQSILTLIPRLLLEIMGVIGMCSTIYILLILNYSMIEIIPLITFLALAIIRIIPSFAALSQNINNISSNMISFQLVSNLIKFDNLKKKQNNNHQFKSSTINVEDIKTLELKNIFFTYDLKKNNILNDISFKIYKNDILGVIGASGSGKTTLLNLILGLLKPTNGKILINDKDRVKENLKKFEISYVPQEVSILDEGINQNIAYGIEDKKIDKKLIEKLTSITQLDKEGIDFRENLGEAGLNISGGQKQRIGFARGLYGNFSLIVLDEPTSDLDYSTEAKILEYLKQANKSKITILVAHRLETLKICNKILIIEKGRIKDFGEKKDIINRNSYLKKYLDS